MLPAQVWSQSTLLHECHKTYVRINSSPQVPALLSSFGVASLGVDGAGLWSLLSVDARSEERGAGAGMRFGVLLGLGRVGVSTLISGLTSGLRSGLVSSSLTVPGCCLSITSFLMSGLTSFLTAFSLFFGGGFLEGAGDGLASILASSSGSEKRSEPSSSPSGRGVGALLGISSFTGDECSESASSITRRRRLGACLPDSFGS